MEEPFAFNFIVVLIDNIFLLLWSGLASILSLSILVAMPSVLTFFFFWLMQYQYFSGAGWKSLSGKQKQIVSLSLYYAANWIRELVKSWSLQMLSSSLDGPVIHILVCYTPAATCSLMPSVHKWKEEFHVQVKLQKRILFASYWSVWGTLCMFSCSQFLDNVCSNSMLVIIIIII